MKKKPLIKISACALACATLVAVTGSVMIHCCHAKAEDNFCRNDDYLRLCVYAALEDDGYCRDDIAEWVTAYDVRKALVVTKDAKTHCFTVKEPQPWVFVWEEIS